MSFARALVFPLLAIALVAGFYSGGVPAFEPIVAVAETSVQNSDGPIEMTAVDRIRSMLFLWGPVTFVGAAFLFPLLYAIRQELATG